MSETPREYDLNFDAANELDNQVKRASAVIQRLAAYLAANEPGRSEQDRDLVEAEHVRHAAETLFGAAEARVAPHPPGTSYVFISFDHQDESFIAELIVKLDAAG